MTPQQLAVATGARIDRATEHLPHIEAAMQEVERMVAIGKRVDEIRKEIWKLEHPK